MTREDTFKQWWKSTEIIREYDRTLFTFGDMQLPYIFAAEHHQFDDRIIVRRGMVVIQKPHIHLPGYFQGPDFGEGFDIPEELSADAMYVLRSMGLPYSRVTNRPYDQEQIEYGRLQSVLDRFTNQLDEHEDNETGLIRGVIDGQVVSLMRYAVSLMVRSAPENVREFIEHMRRREQGPIRPDEHITDDEIDRLFG